MRQQHRLRLSLLAVPAALALGAGIAGAADTSNVAPCEEAITGAGPADWRSESLVAGPVGVLRHPLRRMTRTARGLVTKMPLLVEGREPETVTVSVPMGLRQRVFLYYGDATEFPRGRGHGEIEFEPCRNKPRTSWPGGIRVIGKAPVRLNVFTEYRAEPFVLRLGRPKAHSGANPGGADR